MRNLLQFPITAEEKINAVKKAIKIEEQRVAALDPGHRPMGDIYPVALRVLLKDLEKG